MTNLYADTIEPVRRSQPSELFYVRIEVRPAPDNPEAVDTGGAFVNCWVDADDLRTAELRAVALVQEQGWEPRRFDAWKLVCRESYSAADEKESLQAVEDAFRDGATCILYCWPPNAPDAAECSA